MGGVRPDLHFLWCRNRRHVALRHARLDSPFDRQGGPLVSLGHRGVRVHGPAVSPRPALGSCGDRNGLDSFVLDSHDSRFLVRRETNKSWRWNHHRGGVAVPARLIACWRSSGPHSTGLPVPPRSPRHFRSSPPNRSDIAIIHVLIPWFSDSVVLGMHSSLSVGWSSARNGSVG